MRSCSIVDNFINVRNNRFIIIDQLNNTNSLSADDIDDLLLQKERF